MLSSLGLFLLCLVRSGSRRDRMHIERVSVRVSADPNGHPVRGGIPQPPQAGMEDLEGSRRAAAL